VIVRIGSTVPVSDDATDVHLPLTAVVIARDEYFRSIAEDATVVNIFTRSAIIFSVSDGTIIFSS